MPSYLTNVKMEIPPITEVKHLPFYYITKNIAYVMDWLVTVLFTTTVTTLDHFSVGSNFLGSGLCCCRAVKVKG